MSPWLSTYCPSKKASVSEIGSLNPCEDLVGVAANQPSLEDGERALKQAG